MDKCNSRVSTSGPAEIEFKLAGSSDRTTMPYVDLSTGERDYYEVDDFTDPWKGDSVEIVVFQPGISRLTEHLYHLVPLLSGKVRFIRRDLRGHGRSSGGDSKGYKYTLDTLAAEMAEFVDKVAGRPVHWIGESTAGMVSIAFGEQYPDKLKSLIIMSSPLVLPDSFKQMVSEPYADYGTALRKMGLLKWQHSRPVSRLGTGQKKEGNEMGRFSGPGYLKWYDEMLLKHDLEGMAKYTDFIMPVDVTPCLPRIKVPTLILAPTRSAASPPELNEKMAREISRSKLVVVDGVGHMIYIDEPEQVCDAIKAWATEGYKTV